MANDASQQSGSGDAWRELGDLVERIAKLSKSERSEAAFCADVLDQVVVALAADGGAIWTEGPQGQLRRTAYVGGPEPWLADEVADGSHARLVSAILRSRTGRTVLPHRKPAGDDPACNPTGLLLVLAPWQIDSFGGVVETFHRPGASPQAQQGYLRFLEVIGEVIADFYRNLELGRLRQRTTDWQRLDQFIRQVHADLGLRATAYAVANEGRRLLDCDRVSVLVRRGRRCRLTAISGSDTFRRRASAVRHLERLAGAVVAIDEPLWHPSKDADRPPEIEALLSEHLDSSPVRCLAVVPLQLSTAPEDTGTESERPLGALVVEQFHGTLDERQRALLAEIAVHSGLALANSLDMETLPLAPLLRKMRGAFRVGRMFVLGLVTAVLALAALALARLPADFTVEARGELQPQRMRDVFAATDGVVGELRATHGQHVAEGQVLAVLRRPQLDLEFKQIWGELETSRKKLVSLEADRLRIPRETDEQRRQYSLLTAQDEELRETIRSLDQQYTIVRQRQGELEVRSPMAGDVLTWNVEQLLEARPVNRGQSLLTIGDLAGAWHLELRLPDRYVAHLLAAQRDLGEDLEVSYILATEPGVRLSGKIERVEMRSEPADGENSYMAVVAAVRREELPQRVPGSSVKAVIHCGTRPLSYVWFHDLWDAIQTWFLF